MLIKKADDRAHDIETLQALLTHPDATAAVRNKIKKEVQGIRVGAKNEKDVAYQINFYLKAVQNWAVIHDLRLEHKGRVAQIDHILINRFLEMWVCESKYWSQGVAINAHGEFTGFYGQKAIGIPSPIEQNRKHISVLRAMIKDKAIKLPVRLGRPLNPKIHSLILVSPNGRITRPEKHVKGLDTIIKTDQFVTYIEQSFGKGTPLEMFRLVSSASLKKIADDIASVHAPISFSYDKKFGLGPIVAEPQETYDDGVMSKYLCAACDASVPLKVARFCWFNKSKFNSKIYCRNCQKDALIASQTR